jgi:flagellar biosynthetic protein FliQ
MNDVAVLEIARQGFFVVLLLAGPLMVVATVVGLVVALFQALTTVQEATLTFAPKIVAMFAAMLLLLPFMMTTLIEFTRELFSRAMLGG